MDSLVDFSLIEETGSATTQINTQKWLKDKLDLLKELKMMFYNPNNHKLSNHLSKYMNLVGRLVDFGIKLDNSDILCYLLLTLPVEFEAVVIGYCESEVLSLEVVVARLLLRSTRVKKYGKKARGEDYPLYKPEPEVSEVEKKEPQPQTNCYGVEILKDLRIKLERVEEPVVFQLIKDEPMEATTSESSNTCQNNFNMSDDDGDNGWSEPKEPVSLELVKDEPVKKSDDDGDNRWSESEPEQPDSLELLVKDEPVKNKPDNDEALRALERKKYLKLNRKRGIKNLNKCFQCDVCAKIYSAKRNFLKHFYKHLNEFPCKMCSEVFKTHAEYMKHRIECMERSSVCIKCGKNILNKIYKTHIYNHRKRIRENEGSGLCSSCGYNRRACECQPKLTKQTKLNKQTKRTKLNKQTKQNKTTQMKPKKQEIVRCNICSKSMKATSMKEHMLIHEKKLRFPCNLCGEAFIWQSSLMMHTHKAHGVALPYVCHICDRHTYSQIILDRHVRSHQKIKAFICDICGKSFSSNNSLKRHEQDIHRGGERHLCDFCTKVYKHKYELLAHIKKSHKEETSKECGICSKSFPTTILLQSHLRTHTGEAPFECLDCALAFPSETRLKVHLDTDAHAAVASKFWGNA